MAGPAVAGVVSGALSLAALRPDVRPGSLARTSSPDQRYDLARQPAGCDRAAERRRRERTEYLMAFEGQDASIIT
jgi:DNA-binding transcriptional regulator YdaS (Cro superfamily)